MSLSAALSSALAGPGVSPVASGGSSGTHAGEASCRWESRCPARLLAMRGPGTHPQPLMSPASLSIHNEHMQIRDNARFGYHDHHPGTINIGTVNVGVGSSSVAGPGVAGGPGVGVGAARHSHTLGMLLNHPHPSPQTQALALSCPASPSSISGTGVNCVSISPTISLSANPATTPSTNCSPTLTSTATATSASASTQTCSPGGTKQLHLSPVSYMGPLSPHLSHAPSPHAESPHLQLQSHPASPYQSDPGSPHPHVHSPLTPTAHPQPLKAVKQTAMSECGAQQPSMQCDGGHRGFTQAAAPRAAPAPDTIFLRENGQKKFCRLPEPGSYL
ncbi:hypothetical protein K439DRAFT_1519711 [Ramaria rubella]|nr:hypothetical protein K439DRAFT_1519711 [Ramaria rubella]